jgi:hypothetical protein
MSGSAITAAWPAPLSLAARALLATLVVAGVGHLAQHRLVSALLPAFTTTMWVLDDRFIIEEAAVVQEGDSENVRFRANLARPVVLGGQVIDPFGWNGRPLGGIQVSDAAGGVLLYPALMLIVVLAWPFRRAAELGMRIVLSLVAALLLILVDVPTTMLAELWHALQPEHALSPAQNGWMVWSRYLMGGGGLVLALCLGVACIALARRLSGPTRASAPGRQQSEAQFSR